MQEFSTVSASSYDPASLAAKLTEKSAEGWMVVGIVPTGGDVTAFLAREAGAAPAAAAASADVPAATVATPEPELTPAAVDNSAFMPTLGASTPVATPTPEPVAEPAGWAVAPEPASPSPAAETTVMSSVAPEPVSAYQPAAQPTYEPVAQPAAQPVQQAATPSVPAGWYSDPAGRFELRYWDGNTWTEHVSRAGQQYTDPPVA